MNNAFSKTVYAPISAFSTEPHPAHTKSNKRIKGLRLSRTALRERPKARSSAFVLAVRTVVPSINTTFNP